MNSEKIREAHQETYRNFFEENEIVVSANYSMPWSNELIDHASKFPLVRSKLPLKCYVWLRRKTEPWAVFSTLEAYVGEKEGFEKTQWSAWSSAIGEAEKILSEHLASNSFAEWLEISALCEIPRGRSIGFTETVNAAIAFGIHAAVSQNSGNAAKEHSWEMSESELREIIDFAWTLSLKPRKWNTMAQGIRNSFSTSSWPIAYFWGKFDHNTIAPSEVPLWQKRLQADEDNVVRLPMDIWVIYSWVPWEGESFEEIRQSDCIEQERLWLFFKTVTSDAKFNIESDYSLAAFENVKRHLNFRWMELIERMSRFWWADESLVERFVQNLNDSRALLAMVSEQGPFAREIADQIRGNCECEVGITPLYSWKYGGSYLIACNRQSARKAVEESVRYLSKAFPGLEILYASYADGISCDGVRLLKNQKGSPRTRGKRILLMDDFWNRKYCWYIEALERKEGEILFDSISKKVYFNGKRLTSKEIPSQNAASDLFEMLIEKIGCEIPNKSLPASSYSQNKNEMVSKIISPLTKFAKIHANSELNISCSGSLTEFRIMLERSNVRLWIIKHE